MRRGSIMMSGCPQSKALILACQLLRKFIGINSREEPVSYNSGRTDGK